METLLTQAAKYPMPPQQALFTVHGEARAVIMKSLHRRWSQRTVLPKDSDVSSRKINAFPPHWGKYLWKHFLPSFSAAFINLSAADSYLRLYLNILMMRDEPWVASSLRKKMKRSLEPDLLSCVEGDIIGQLLWLWTAAEWDVWTANGELQLCSVIFLFFVCAIKKI